MNPEAEFDDRTGLASVIAVLLVNNPDLTPEDLAELADSYWVQAKRILSKLEQAQQIERSKARRPFELEMLNGYRDAMIGNVIQARTKSQSLDRFERWWKATRGIEFVATPLIKLGTGIERSPKPTKEDIESYLAWWAKEKSRIRSTARKSKESS